MKTTIAVIGLAAMVSACSNSHPRGGNDYWRGDNTGTGAGRSTENNQGIQENQLQRSEQTGTPNQANPAEQRNDIQQENTESNTNNAAPQQP